MPDFGNPRNPLDGTGAMYENAEMFPRLVDVLLHDDAVDVMAVNMRANVPRPGGSAPSRGFARTLAAAVSAGTDRLVFCFGSHAAGDLDQEVVGPLAAAGVPFLEATETAMQALRHAREHGRFCARRAGAPPTPSRRPGAWTPSAHGVLGNADAMRLLQEFGIPLVETLTAADGDAAVHAAERIGYPVVLKVDSPDVVHKTDVGGVLIGCADAASVREGCRDVVTRVRAAAPAARIDGVLVQRMIAGGTEMILGLKSDPLFGPAVVCGFGGIFTEILRDVAIRVPPLTEDDPLEMIGELRGAGLLRGARGRRPADIPALAAAILGLAALAEAHRDRLRALDLNPLVVLDAGRGVVALDWLIELA
jgi:acetyltransferase